MERRRASRRGGGLAAAAALAALIVPASLALSCGGGGGSLWQGGRERPLERIPAGMALVPSVLPGALRAVPTGARGRLADADAPAAGEPKFAVAQRYVVRRTLGRTVRIRRLGVGRYGHTVALVWADPLETKSGKPDIVTLGRELVERNLASARTVGRYVWGTSTGTTPTAPSRFRVERDHWWARPTPDYMIPGKPRGKYVMPRTPREPGEEDRRGPTRWP